jgi:hypothetical protein
VKWDDLLELVKTRPRDEAFAMIDEIVAKRPELGTAGNRVKAFLDQFYASAALGDAITAAMGEILNLIRKGKGPVSKAPEVGLV